MPVGLNPPPFPTPDNVSGIMSVDAGSSGTETGVDFAALMAAAAATPLAVAAGSADLVVDEPGLTRRPGLRSGPALVPDSALGLDAGEGAQARGKGTDKSIEGAAPTLDAAALAVLRMLIDPTAPAAMAAATQVPLSDRSAVDAAGRGDGAAATIAASSGARAAGTDLAATPERAAETADGFRTASADAASLLAGSARAATASRDAKPSADTSVDAGTDRDASGQAAKADRTSLSASIAHALSGPSRAFVGETSAGNGAARLTRETDLAAPVGTPAPAPFATALPQLQKLAVETPFATPGWRNEAVEKLGQLVLLRQDSAEIRMHPADLGPVSVQIRYIADEASLVISAAHPATRDALEQALPQLRELLASQGISLGQTSVQAESSFQRQPQDAGQRNRPDGERGADSGSSGEPARVVRVRGHGLVDTFA